MTRIKHHQCHDCPSDALMCSHHRHEFCQGFFKKNATTQMARQVVHKNWDGNFRFPRNHINGKSLEDFTDNELRQLRDYYHARWKIYWERVVEQAKRDRPDWDAHTLQAHEREIDIIMELNRRQTGN